MSSNNSCSTKNKSTLLGSGTFGEVYLFTNKITHETTAIKVLKEEKNKSVLEFDSLIEIDILFRMKSNALVNGIAIYGPRECSNFKSVSFEMPHYGVVTDLLETNILSLENRIFMIYKLLLAVKCLHSNNILHLDIKPENTLYKSTANNPDLVLGDYGLCVPVEDVKKGISFYGHIGSRDYRPPEWLTVAIASDDDFDNLNEESNYSKDRKKITYIYNDKFDMWSVGITALYILCYRKKSKLIIPNYDFHYNELVDAYNIDFSKANITDTLEEILESINIDTSHEYYDDLMELLEGLLTRDPADRFDIDDALNCEIFENIPLPQESKIYRNLIGRRTPEQKPEIKKIGDYPYACINSSNFASKKHIQIQPLTDNNRHGIKTIISMYTTIMGDYYVRDLFDCIDLYMRLVSSTKRLSRDRCVYVGLLCIRMINKFYYHSANNVPSIINDYLSPYMELTALKTIKGVIKEYTFYDLADSEGEIKKYFDLLMANEMEAFNHYFMIDMKKLKDKVMSENKGNQTFKKSKIIECKDFLSNSNIDYSY